VLALVELDSFVDSPSTAPEFTIVRLGPYLLEPDLFLDRLSGSFILCVIFFVLRAPKRSSAIAGNPRGSLNRINIPG
jgi:hypothetical protein